MGLKTTNYEVKEFGVVLPEAYALITDLTVRPDNMAFATISVGKSRETLNEKQQRPLERKVIRCTINKSLPLYEQLYIKAKEEHFPDWEDDIPAVIAE